LINKLKILDFLSLLATHPSEAYGRLEGIADSRLERLWVKPQRYRSSSIDSIHKGLQETLGISLDEFLNEPALARIEDCVRKRLENLPDDSPFPMTLNGDFSLARLSYAACRALRPRQVVETGVCYGVTTAFLLQALQGNGTGTLHSIDLPPLGRKAHDFVGTLVPIDLRARWVLHRGTSRILLPRILKQIGAVDFFIHDSLHTCRNIRRELAIVTPYLSGPALVLSDDIDGNPAFREWVDRVRPPFWTVLEQASKSSLLGVAAFPSVRTGPTEDTASSLSGSS
jgi:hypothetical protein